MMNKKEQIVALATKLSTTQKDAEVIYDAFCEMVIEGLTTEGKIKVGNIATFEVKNVNSRVCRNPKDGTEIVVPEKKKVAVRIASGLKVTINE